MNKRELIDKIYNKLDGAVPKLMIHDIIIIITDHIISELKHNRSFSVKNFGTFSPYVRAKHKAVDIYTKKEKIVEEFTGVKFIPHSVFSNLLNRKRIKFMG